MWCIYSIICWSNIKWFLSIFSCFWKVFCFENSRVMPVARPQSWAYSEALATPGDWVPQSWKILRKFFKIFRFLAFSQLILETWSRVKAPVASLHRKFRNSLAGGPSSREKDLAKIFKIFFKGFWQLESRKLRVLHK